MHGRKVEPADQLLDEGLVARHAPATLGNVLFVVDQQQVAARAQPALAREQRAAKEANVTEVSDNAAAVKPSGRSARSSGDGDLHGLLPDSYANAVRHGVSGRFNPASTLLYSTKHLPQFEQQLESLDLKVDGPGLGKTLYYGQTRYRELYPHTQSDRSSHRNRAVTPLTTNAYVNRALVVRCKFLHDRDASFEAEYRLLCELGAYKVPRTRQTRPRTRPIAWSRLPSRERCSRRWRRRPPARQCRRHPLR